MCSESQLHTPEEQACKCLKPWSVLPQWTDSRYGPIYAWVEHVTSSHLFQVTLPCLGGETSKITAIKSCLVWCDSKIPFCSSVVCMSIRQSDLIMHLQSHAANPYTIRSVTRTQLYVWQSLLGLMARARKPVGYITKISTHGCWCGTSGDNVRYVKARLPKAWRNIAMGRQSRYLGILLHCSL